VPTRLTSPAPWLAALAVPLPLKGARGFRVAAKFDQDLAQDAVEVRQNIVIGEPQHTPSPALKFPRPSDIEALTTDMAVPVELDHQPVRASGEVGDIGCQDDLPLELDAEPARPKTGPEVLFGSRGGGAKLLCVGPGLTIAFQDSPLSLRRFAALPSPPEGGEGARIAA
jgi:hypothetical protein